MLLGVVLTIHLNTSTEHWMTTFRTVPLVSRVFTIKTQIPLRLVQVPHTLNPETEVVVSINRRLFFTMRVDKISTFVLA